MGANGSFANGTTSTEEGRRWKTVAVTESGIKIIEMKKKEIEIHHKDKGIWFNLTNGQ